MNDTSSLFDPQQFLEGAEIVGAMSTKSVPMPLGRYKFQIRKYAAKRITPNDSNKEPFTVLEIDCVASGDQLTPSGETVASVTGKDENFARYSCYLDFTPGGALDLGNGKNVGLGRLRAALNQNDPSQPWKFSMLVGQVFTADVTHRQGKDPNATPFVELTNPLPI